MLHIISGVGGSGGALTIYDVRSDLSWVDLQCHVLVCIALLCVACVCVAPLRIAAYHGVLLYTASEWSTSIVRIEGMQGNGASTIQTFGY